MRGDRLADIAEYYASLARNCFYCGVKLYGGGVVEHMTPRSRGGSDDSSNLTIACQSCNTIKSDRTLREFRVLLSHRMGRNVVFAGETVAGRSAWEHLCHV